MAARLSGGRGLLRAWWQRPGRMAGGATWKTAEGEVRATTDIVGVEELGDRAVLEVGDESDQWASLGSVRSCGTHLSEGRREENIRGNHDISHALLTVRQRVRPPWRAT